MLTTLGPLTSSRAFRLCLPDAHQSALRSALVSLTLAIAVAGGVATAQTRTATATSLAITTSSGAVTTIAAGDSVTLTASVSTGTKSLTVGQVEFCDATASTCTDIHLLGLVQLTTAGTAMLKFRTGIGSHSFKAVFLGTNGYAGSASAASALTVTGSAGQLATSTTVVQTGNWGMYGLTATVTEAGQTNAPTGSVSFLDTSHGNSVVATQTLGSAVAGIGWPNPQAISSLGVRTELVADLNGDGIADLVVNEDPVEIYLGNADGTYTEAPTPSNSGPVSGPMVIADFNGDGIPDLAVAMYSSYSVSILLGKGDGTFQAPMQVPLTNLGANTTQLLTADFNGDGIADLVVVDDYDAAVSILLGNGDGTFTAATSLSIPVVVEDIALGDFNGDGRPDLAVADSSSDLVAMLLGNGDGTFTTGVTVHSGTTAAQIIAADFNGDGKLDLATASGGAANTNESVSMLAGNGDGTFTASQSIQGTASSIVTWIQVADFNRDGVPDVAVADSNGDLSVFINNGTGSFGGAISVVSGLNIPSTLSAGVGDLNGDGYPDIVAGGYYNGTFELFLTEPTETATASADVSLTAGLHLVDASYAGDSAFTTSVSGTLPLWGVPPATTVSLTATSDGSAVTSVSPGTVVTLSASITAGGNPVTAGQVNFCDASAAYCSDIHILGTATVVSGTAIFKFAPGSGAHTYKAVFVEDGYGASSSSNAVSLTVGSALSPAYTDTTTLSFTGFPGDYSLTDTVLEYGATAPLTGQVSFLDTSFGNTSLGTASLGTGMPGLGWFVSQTPSSASAPTGEIQGDFNGDGIPDLALLVSPSQFGSVYSVTILLGKGDGTFTSGATTTIPATANSSVVPQMITGDFNGDGKTDLAILNSTDAFDTQVTVLLSNGNGTFAAQQTSPAYNQPSQGGDVVPGSMVAADFNGDGMLDLAIVGGGVTSGEVTILAGKGDGTFTSSGTSYGYASSFDVIAAGDFNRDGIPDLVVANDFAPAGAYVLLGKGDGTFTAMPTQIPVDAFVNSIQVGDFNGDGSPDLAFGYSSGVGVFLGNGDGTFTPASSSPSAGAGVSLIAADFNHDGKLDLAGIDSYNSQIDIFLGAGDGTFTETVTTPNVSTQLVGVQSIVAADFNSDGVPDLALVNSIADSASILLTEPTQTASATITALAPVGAGTHDVDASYPGNSNYPSSVSNIVPLTAGLAPLTITPAAGSYSPVQQVVITESVPGATIYYEESGVISSGLVQYTGPIVLTAAGSETIQAYAAETGYVATAFAQATYILSGATPTGTQVATVTVTPASTNLTNAQTLSVTVAVAGASGQPTPTGFATLTVGTWSQQQALVSGSAAFTAPAGLLNAGINTLLATYTGDSTYAGASGTATVTVTPTASSGQAVSPISPGAIGTSAISFFAGTTYSGTLNVTCALTASPTGAQSLPTCSMNPTSVPLTSGGTGKSTLTVQTTAAVTTAQLHPAGQSLRWLGGGGVTLATILLFGMPARRRRWASLLSLLVATILFGALGCGGASSGGSGGGGGGGSGGGQTTPATTTGNYTFKVTGTDSTNPLISTSTSVVITVQ